MATPAAAITDRPLELTAEEIRDDVADALRDQGYKPNQAKAAAASALGDTFSEMFKSALEWLHKARSSGQLERTNTMKQKQPAGGASPKLCPGYERECGGPLRPRNTSGLCTKCYARKMYHQRNGKASRKPAKASARRVSISTVVNHARVALEVTEAQLDQFLTRLPLQEKLRLANHYLQFSEI